ncbi:molybdate transporter 1-like [Forsythia ovata]|uniref:Molybdate transporter 1-like n=1 Tax=Forsythia ovata TaxID=205694 RepID=A0ABD1WQQ2_9LAMI
MGYRIETEYFSENDVLAMSVFGIMNLIGYWFGATSCCHGAGGLAGQYKFGGRSGWCMALLGVAKLVLGLVLGSSLVKILDQFPVGVLGVLLLFVGIELCSRDINSKEESAKLQPRRSTKSASSQSHVPQQTEFEFMPTPGIIPQQLSGPDAALTGNDLQPHFSFQNMVDDLQLMENEEQSRMKAHRAKNRSIVRDSVRFHAPRKMKPN